MPTLHQIINQINILAPWELAESWDNSGLQVGKIENTAHKILLAVDFNRKVFDEGLTHGVDGYLVHHPLFFNPLHQINLATPLGNHIEDLIKQNQFLVSVHTNIDKAQFGINHYLAEILQLNETAPIQPSVGNLQKIVTFVPENAYEPLRQAMARAGAGKIGNYEQCAFSCLGTGSFKPVETANPVIGTKGKLELVPEIRLEMIFSKKSLPSVIKAIYAHHPYEEPVYDIYPLNNPLHHGLGKIGHLSESQTLGDFYHFIQNRFKNSHLRVCGEPLKKIQTVAVCSGSGKSLIPDVIAQSADLYITADLTYHDYILAAENGLALIDLGHWTSEQFFIPLMADYLGKSFPPNELQIIKSNAMQGEPYQFIWGK